MPVNQLTVERAITDLLDCFTKQWSNALSRLVGSEQQITSKEMAAEDPNSEELWLTATLEGTITGEIALALSSADVQSLEGSLVPPDASAEGPAIEPANAVIEALRQAMTLALKDFQTHHGALVGQIKVTQAPIWTAAKTLHLESSSGQNPGVTVHVLYSPDLQVHEPDAHTSPRSEKQSSSSGDNLNLVMDAMLEVSLRFGQHQIRLADLAELGPGSVIELDRRVEEPVELVLGSKILARGEVMIVDGNYGLRVTELMDRS